MRISDGSSDVCSSDLGCPPAAARNPRSSPRWPAPPCGPGRASAPPRPAGLRPPGSVSARLLPLAHALLTPDRRAAEDRRQLAQALKIVHCPEVVDVREQRLQIGREHV